MYKRFLTVIITILMATMIVTGFSAFAALPEMLPNIDDDGNIEGAGIAFDNFEQSSTASGQNKYPGSFGESDVFTDYTGTLLSGAFSIVDRTDAYGLSSRMLEVKSRGWGTAYLPIKTIKYREGLITRVSYHICFDELASDDKTSITLGAGNTNYNLFTQTSNNVVLKGSWSGRSYTLSPDTWYKVEIIINAAGKQTVYLRDIYTGETLLYSDSTTHSDGAEVQLHGLILGDNSDTSVVLIDNAEIVIYDPSEYMPSIIKKTIENDASDVRRNQELIFVFDQELADNPSVSFTRAKDGSDVPEARTEKISGNTLSVTYGGMLEKGTEYMLSFDGVSNGEINSTETIKFTTEKMHLWKDITISSAVAGETGTDITFTIGDDYGYPTFTGSVMAAVYQAGKMLDVDIKPLAAVEVGELAVSFDLGVIPEDAEINVILLDVEGCPVPLAGGRFEK